MLKQPITNTDYYGNAIARYLLGKGNTVYENNYVPDYLTLQLGEQARWQGKNYELPQAYVPHLPFPIYTAVTPLRNVEPSLFPWFEFTPYQIGTALHAGDNKTGMFVKTWSFGRKFKNGISADYAPEQSLEFFLGIFSSAMNSSLKETLNMLISPTKLRAAATYLRSIPGAGYFYPENRWRFSEVLNPMMAWHNLEIFPKVRPLD